MVLDRLSSAGDLGLGIGMGIEDMAWRTPLQGKAVKRVSRDV